MDLKDRELEQVSAGATQLEGRPSRLDDLDKRELESVKPGTVSQEEQLGGRIIVTPTVE